MVVHMAATAQPEGAFILGNTETTLGCSTAPSMIPNLVLGKYWALRSRISWN